MTAPVGFDPEDFREIYPQFANFTDKQLDFFARAAGRYAGGADDLEIIRYLVCHLCELAARGNSAVGAFASASEGSVSVSYSSLKNAKAEWFNQTQCGAAAWQMLAATRTGGRLYVGCFR